jgi:phosphoenolpyruvate carboxylase
MAERQVLPLPQQPADTASRHFVRLLGRQLGEVIREQHGENAFDHVEGLRRHVVNEHRQGRSAVPLIRRLSYLSSRDLVLMIRAFAIFSQLANISDDYAIRAGAASAGEGPLERLRQRPEMTAERVYEYLAGALICPVITAHPTEVRRQSIIEREAAIAELLRAHQLDGASEGKQAAIETRLKREIRTLWQTRMLRPERIHVTDEINNAAAILGRTFVSQLPAVKRKIAELFGFEGPLPTILQAGSWVGGDRDGNPFVSAASLEFAVRRFSGIALDHYAEQLHSLGRELSLSDEFVSVSKTLLALAAQAPAPSPHKADEPYRPPCLRPAGFDEAGTARLRGGRRRSRTALPLRPAFCRRHLDHCQFASRKRQSGSGRGKNWRAARRGTEFRVSPCGHGLAAKLRRA